MTRPDRSRPFLSKSATNLARATAALTLASCGTASLPASTGVALTPSPGALSPGGTGQIEVRRLDNRPKLALVNREGDPFPAAVAVVATGLGSASTTALAAIVERRLRAAGFEAEVHVDRDAFRAQLPLTDPTRARALFTAFAAALSTPIAAGTPDTSLAAQRLASLRRNPLDAAELGPVGACTGALGIVPGESVPDLTTAAAIHELEAARRETLRIDRVSIAAVGPAAFGAAVAEGLLRSEGWVSTPSGPKLSDAWPATDTTGVYAMQPSDPVSARLTMSAIVADPEGAAGAAERLGAPESPLIARLRALPMPYRLVQVSGAARTRGGCVSAVIEAERAASPPDVGNAALAAAIVRSEIAAEIEGGGKGTASRSVLTANDPGEAAARAAWWSLASKAPDAPPRFSTALGLGGAADRGREMPLDPAIARRFVVALESTIGAPSAPLTERRTAVERGQGEVWVLLASPCGVAEEGPLDAGVGALATVAAVETLRHKEGVAVDPWISADGVGVIAHAVPRTDRESGPELARRVADAAARALTTGAPTAEGYATARASILNHLEHAWGHRGAGLAALASAVSPDHPSWLEPLGLWARIAVVGPDTARLRARALASGPLRVAVIANVDAAQAGIAGHAIDRWLLPTALRTCQPGPTIPPRAGHFDVHLPDGAQLAQGLVSVPVPPPGAPGHDLAELLAAALDGDGGMLAGVLRKAAATGSARVVGGTRAAALVIDLRAPSEGLSFAVSEVRALLGRLATTVSDGDLNRASARVTAAEQEARSDPRRRLIDLWSDRRPPTNPKATLAAWRTFLATALRDGTAAVIEAKPD